MNDKKTIGITVKEKHNDIGKTLCAVFEIGMDKDLYDDRKKTIYRLLGLEIDRLVNNGCDVKQSIIDKKKRKSELFNTIKEGGDF